MAQDEYKTNQGCVGKVIQGELGHNLEFDHSY